mgnify:CR=1 FL=1
MLKQTYRIEIDNSDETTSILYAQRPKCKTAKGRDAQHNRVVNEVVESLREIRGWLYAPDHASSQAPHRSALQYTA